MNPQPDPSAQVDAYLNSIVQPDAPGAAVIIVKEGVTLYKAGYGLADVENGVPIKPATIFHLGSVGKQFTGLALMMLAEEGRLHYDDPVGKYLPQLARFGDEVTIRRMLHHTSGWPDYYEGELNDLLFERSDLPDNEDVLAMMAESGELLFKPGERFDYSNSAYEILGSVVEHVSGQSLDGFLQARVFGPLNMTSTFSQPNPERLTDPNLAHSYIKEDGQLERYDSDPLDRIVGSGSEYSTVEDMALYDQALYTDQLIKQSVLAEAFQPATLNDGSLSNYGFGWELGEYNGQQYIGHQGDWLGFIAYHVRFPQQQLGVIVLFNRDYDLPDEDVALQIAGMYSTQ
jgi:CubicO group peptidase (beta-lactamase class C family)